MIIVAEISCSHNGSLNEALALVREVSQEADAVKFQLWTPGTMAVDHTLTAGPWKGRTLNDLYKQAYTPREWFPALYKACTMRGAIPFASVFDMISVAYLESIDTQMYKISSFELVDLELVDYVARLGKPLIMSCGQADRNEIKAAVQTARKHISDITLLHCVSEYPTPPEHMNLKTMYGLERFRCKIGLSDHSLGMSIPIAAAAMGAKVIEKHVKLENGDGLDDGFAMTGEEFNEMCRECRKVELAIGDVKYGGDTELRRSLYFAQDLPAGVKVARGDMKTARPNKGLSPIKINEVLGRRLNLAVRLNDPVSLDVFQSV